MTKIRVFAILALGGLVALGASGQTSQGGGTIVYPPPPAAESAFPAADEGAADQADQVPDASVTLVEPYDSYGELSLDELSAALSMPAGPQPWDLGEFDRWQESPARHDYSEPVVIIDEGQAIVGLIDLPAEEGQAQAQLAAAQPQALPTEPSAPQTWPRALPTEPSAAQVAPQPVMPSAPLTANALTSAYGAAGTVYATTAEYSCEPPMYAPTYYSYYYAYPYYCASAVPPWWNPHWPLRASYYSYPQWPDYYGLYYSSAYGFPYDSYFGVYVGYPYGGYYGTYYGYPYSGYFGTYYGYPYSGYFGTYCGYPYGSYYRSFRHPSYFGSGSFLGFSFGGSSWSIYGNLGLWGHRDWHYRSGHDRDDFLSHYGSRSIPHGGVSSSRSSSGGVLVRPWRPSVSHQIAAARNGRSYELSTDRSRLGQHGPVDLGHRSLSTASGAGARNQLQQSRDAYLDVLRRPSAGHGGGVESLSTGGKGPALGAGGVSRRPSGPAIDSAVTARQQEMRDSLLRRLSAMPGGSGAAGAAAGPTRPHSTFGPQVAPQQPALPGNSAPAGPRSLTPRSLTPRDVTPRTSTTPSVTPRTLTTPSVTITPTPRTTSTLPTPESRFSLSTWPHNSTATPDSTPPRSYTPRTFTPPTAAPSFSRSAPSTPTPSRSYTPSTYTPPTAAPSFSRSAPSTPAPSRSYTPSTYTPPTAAPSFSRSAPSATAPSRSYTPSTYTPPTAAPSFSRSAPSTPAPSRSYTPSTYTPPTAAPSFSRSAPSFSRFSPAPRAPSGPAISAPPARTYGPAPSQAPSAPQSDRSSSFTSRRAATDDTAPPGRRR